MRNQILGRRIAAVVLGALIAVGGCKSERTAEDTQPGAVPAPAGAPAQVTALELGSAIGPDKRVTGATTEFRPEDTIYASVVTQGSSSSVTLKSRWTYEDGQLVDESTQTIAPSGTEVTEFHVSKPGGWPKGKYRVEVSVDGAAGQTKEFEVK
jgi:hypothetical protein